MAPARQDVYNSFVQAGGALGIVCLSHLSEYVGSVADVMSLYLFGTFQLSLLTTIPAFCGLDLKMQLGENLFALGNRSNLPLKRRKSLENLEKSDLLTPQPSRWQNFISHVRLTGRYLCFSPFTAFLAFRFIFSLFGDSLLLYYPTAMGKDSSLALVAFGLGRLFGLLVFTFLSPRKDFGHTSILCGVACFLGGAALCSLHPNQSQIALMAVGPIWGFWSSATLTLEVNMLRRIMRCHYNDTLHILYLANGFGTFLGPFLGLNFEAIYGGYRELFLASGLGIIFAGCLSFLVAFLLAKVGPFHT